MPRPRKRRRLARRAAPGTLIYKPAGVPLEGLKRVQLLPEELEALRLADLEDLEQAQAAEQMGISRSTFQRILAKDAPPGSAGAGGRGCLAGGERRRLAARDHLPAHSFL